MRRRSELDVLITVSADTPKGWVNQCRRSVATAVSHAGFPVNVIEVPGVPGSIVDAMSDGVRRSESRYVAWVDDDDWVLPNAFSCLQRHLFGNPSAIYAREARVLSNGHIVVHHGRHHLTAWHRDILATGAHLRRPAAPLYEMQAEAGDDAIDELSWVYMRRIRLSGGMKIRREEHAAV